MKVKTDQQGAATQRRVATDPQLANTTGEYFADCEVKPTSHPQATNAELAAELWTRTEEAVSKLR